MQNKSVRATTTRRNLVVEGLENRSLLAGDVAVSVIEGVLTIKGDDAGNGVHIRQLVEPATTAGQPPVIKWGVAGTDTADGATTINGGSDPFITSGRIRTIIMDLGKGDDVVGIANPRPETTDGTTPPPARPVWIPGNPLFALGEGNDTLRARVINGGFLKIGMGAGDDAVSLGGSAFNAVAILGDLPLPKPVPGTEPTEPGAAYAFGADTINWENSGAAGPVAIDTMGGDDAVSITGRSGIRGGLGIRLGNGADKLVMGNAPAADATTNPPPVLLGRGALILGGGGDDQIGLQGVSAVGRLAIDTAGGADTVSLNRVSATDGIFAWLGAGNDTLSVTKSRGPKGVFLGSEGDADTFNNGGENQFRTLTVSGFELPAPTTETVNQQANSIIGVLIG